MSTLLSLLLFYLLFRLVFYKVIFTSMTRAIFMVGQNRAKHTAIRRLLSGLHIYVISKCQKIFSYCVLVALVQQRRHSYSTE